MDCINLNSPLTNIYDRQDGIDCFTNKSAMVIGCGGVGSWIAIDLALIGVGTVILIDPDKLESSNLNRTLFKLNQVGSYKTKALHELILERRPDTIVVTIEDIFQTHLLDKYNVDFIFDATDNLATRQLIKETQDKHMINYCKSGYDGFNATISLNDFDSGRWGDDGSYTVVPSFFGTPQIESALAVIEMLLVDGNRSKSVNFNVKKLLNKIKDTQ